MVKNEQTDLHRSATRFLRPDVIFASGYCDILLSQNRINENIFLLLLIVCLFLTSHQQLRSYGDPRLKAGNRSCDPRFTGQAVYPLHQSGSYILTTELSCPTESLVHDVECVTVLLFCSSRTAHENLGQIP